MFTQEPVNEEQPFEDQTVTVADTLSLSQARQDIHSENEKFCCDDYMPPCVDFQVPTTHTIYHEHVVPNCTRPHPIVKLKSGGVNLSQCPIPYDHFACNSMACMPEWRNVPFKTLAADPEPGMLQSGVNSLYSPFVKLAEWILPVSTYASESVTCKPGYTRPFRLYPFRNNYYEPYTCDLMPGQVPTTDDFVRQARESNDFIRATRQTRKLIPTPETFAMNN